MKKTDILVVLDRSGSMSSIADDTIGGFNTFLAEQQKVKGKCRLTLLQFDDEHEFVHEGVKIKDVPPLTHKTFVPRGMTALLDAIMRGIGKLETLDGKLKIAVILTDGHENASKEASHQAVMDAIKAKEAEGWSFIYLGANQDAIAVGRSMGLNVASNFTPDSHGTRSAYQYGTRAVADFRSSGGDQSVTVASAEEQEAMKKGSTTGGAG